MIRCIAVASALGLWAVPVAAQELRLEPPTLSAQAERCGAAERALCPSTEQRGIETNLQCDACLQSPMPPEMTATPHTVPGKSTLSPVCLPGASRPAPPSCVDAPRLDAIPRP